MSFYKLHASGDFTLKVCLNSQNFRFYIESSANVPEKCTLEGTVKAFKCSPDLNILQVISFPELSNDIDNLIFVEIDARSIRKKLPDVILFHNLLQKPLICEGFALVVIQKSKHGPFDCTPKIQKFLII